MTVVFSVTPAPVLSNFTFVARRCNRHDGEAHLREARVDDRGGAHEGDHARRPEGDGDRNVFVARVAGGLGEDRGGGDDDEAFCFTYMAANVGGTAPVVLPPTTKSPLADMPSRVAVTIAVPWPPAFTVRLTASIPFDRRCGLELHGPGGRVPHLQVASGDRGDPIRRDDLDGRRPRHAERPEADPAPSSRPSRRPAPPPPWGHSRGPRTAACASRRKRTRSQRRLRRPECAARRERLVVGHDSDRAARHAASSGRWRCSSSRR